MNEQQEQNEQFAPQQGAVEQPQQQEERVTITPEPIKEQPKTINFELDKNEIAFIIDVLSRDQEVLAVNAIERGRKKKDMLDVFSEQLNNLQ